MKVIILSGGSGKRLWPLSNDSRSKQFLKVLSSEDGSLESMVQRVWKQISQAGLADSSIVATGKAQVDILESQLGQEIEMVIEPERRDTFPAIALSAVYLYSVCEVSPNETITVLPVDPFVDNNFFEYFKKFDDVLEKSSADLALIGVKPTFPSSKYGYIVPNTDDHKDSEYIRVNHFVEKPDDKFAEHLISKNALWNCGVFSFKLEYLLSILQNLNLPIQYEELQKQYNQIPRNSFDYEVVEKAGNIVAIQYDGYWKDLGTWNTLTDEMYTTKIGKGIMCEESDNTHLINELDIPIAVLGISNAVIAASPDGILISDKNSSPKVKSLISSFEQRPMFEERRWGWYKVLDYAKFENGEEVLTKRLGVNAGKNLSYQRHFKRSEVWTVIKGEGTLIVDEKPREVAPGSVIEIPLGANHGIKAHTDIEIIEVQKGTELIEEDIHRLFLDWDETIAYCNLINS